MERKHMRVALIALCGALFASVASAQADTADIIAPQSSPPSAADGWQAGTCTSDVPECSPETPNLFFTQAAGHPPVGFTQFIVKHETSGLLQTPVGVLKDVRVDLPVGLSVNPQATAQCDLATFTANAAGCPATAVVGVSEITVSEGGIVLPPVPAQVYNLVPSPGEPALFGFSAVGQNVFLKSDIEWNGDYHEGFTIAVPAAPLGSKILKNRLVFNGVSGNGTFLTNPSTCDNPAQAPHLYSTFLRADSVEAPNGKFPAGSTPFEAALPPGVKPTGCDKVPFAPTISVKAGTSKVDSPEGTAVSVAVPFVPSSPIADSDVRTAATTLAAGMGLNPSAAAGLVACTDAQFGKGTTQPVACPAKSKVGTVAIETPPLPPGSVSGNVYLGQQLSREPASGKEYRIFVDAESARYGISARLVGEVSANPATGQLTATFAENPQVPFSSFVLQFNGGQTAPLTSPPTCGPNTTKAQISPWSGGASAAPTSSFTLSSAPAGGKCPKTLAARPFAPGFAAKAKSAEAGAFSPFSLHVSRNDGEQELKGVDVTLPPGLSGKLAGIPYCPAKAIAQAASRAGATEKKSPSCPAKSQIGVATVKAGSGTAPVTIEGRAYLAGPYRGAPLSLAVVTPAAVGPFDLGTVVVRVALFVDPDTAQIHAVSDPIPDVFGGAKLDVRSVEVNAVAHEFTINPTSCGQLQTAGALLGGGANPTNPAAFSSFPVSAPFQTSECGKLPFRPRLTVKLLGGRRSTHRAKSPQLRAVLIAGAGNANLARAAVTLPRSLLIEQASLGTICTRVQLAASECPQKSIYGHATAESPLLGQPLSGPVYLLASEHQLPDLLVDLRGQVEIHLHAVVESVHARIKNVFYSVPDVPVSKFVLTIRGGKHGLLVNSSNLCKGRNVAKIALTAQNGKKRTFTRKRSRLSVPACHGHKHKHKHRHRHGHRQR